MFIVRHGDTDYNAGEGKERIRGHAPVPLDEDGIAQARRAGNKLKPKGIKAIYASDLPRAAQTARIIGTAIGIEPIFDGRLRTWDAGKFTGELCEDAEAEVHSYIRKPDVPIPGNDKYPGESFNAFKERFFAGLADAVEACPDGLCVVTHHSCVSLLDAWCEEGRPADHSINIKAYINNDDDPGSVAEFETTVAELRGDALYPEEHNDEEGEEDEVPIVGLAENPAGIPFQCGACEYFDGKVCQKDRPELKGRPVQLTWCCDFFRHPGMRVIVP